MSLGTALGGPNLFGVGRIVMEPFPDHVAVDRRASKREEVEVDYAGLAESLAALSYPARLELLDHLRFPHAVSEVRLSPLRSAPGENPERASSKQAVQAHVDKLVDAGLVRMELADTEGRAAHRYTVNLQSLYAVVEELRRLSVRYAGRGAVGDATGTMVASEAPPVAKGVRLVLVHGVYEGKSFPLTDETAVDGAWTIGRQRGLPIALDYDPFVSALHARITRSGAHFALADLPESKNGTSVNWEMLGKAERRTLRPADVIGVGRSLLTFVPE